MPFVVAGMAVARLDLARTTVRARLALTGGALAVLGHGGSWLALTFLPHARATVAAATDGDTGASAWWSDTVGELLDHTPPAAWLLVGAPHSRTTFSILGNTGVALAALAACLAFTDRMPRLTRGGAPVTAVGTIALTASFLHILAIRVVGREEETVPALLALLAFTAAALLLATLWTRSFCRGPLEHLLHHATPVARRIK